MKSLGTPPGSVSIPFNCETVVRLLIDLSTSSPRQTNPDLHTVLDRFATRRAGYTLQLCRLARSPP